MPNGYQHDDVVAKLQEHGKKIPPGMYWMIVDYYTNGDSIDRLAAFHNISPLAADKFLHKAIDMLYKVSNIQGADLSLVPVSGVYKRHARLPRATDEDRNKAIEAGIFKLASPIRPSVGTEVSTLSKLRNLFPQGPSNRR